MGWALGLNNEGREIGYSVAARCEHPGCDEEIDCGLAYCCGQLDAPTFHGDQGCGHYFCGSHLFMGKGNQLCEVCFDEIPWDDDAPLENDGSRDG